MLNVAIIGMGQMGTRYAEIIFKNKDLDINITAITRIKEKSYELLKDYLNDVKIYNSDKDLFLGFDNNEFKIDAVIIATPHLAHEYATLEAFKRNLHVLCDKPAAILLKNARLMYENKPDSIKYAYVFHHRTYEIYKYLKNVLESKKYGNIKRVSFVVTDWYRRNEYYKSSSWRATYKTDGGGLLVNQCPHSLDTIYNLFGLPKMIRAFISEGKYHNIEVDDDITSYMEYDNNMTLTFISSTGETPSINRMEIVLDKALITAYKDYIEIRENEFIEEEYRNNSNLLIKENKEIINFNKNEAYYDIILNFKNAILYDEKIIADGYDSLMSLYIANSLYYSSWKDISVELYPIGSDKEIEFENEYNKLFETKL